MTGTQTLQWRRLMDNDGLEELKDMDVLKKSFLEEMGERWGSIREKVLDQNKKYREWVWVK